MRAKLECIVTSMKKSQKTKQNDKKGGKKTTKIFLQAGKLT